MLGYYIYEDSVNVPYGVRKKIKNQVHLFDNKLERCCELPIKADTSIFAKIKKRISIFSNGVKWKSGMAAINADYLYIRKVPFSFDFLFYLKKIKNANKKCKIVIEIPTFPYDDEMKLSGIKMWPILLKDILVRQHLHKYVDYLTVIGKSPERLWNIPVIHMCNGVQMEKIRVRIPQDRMDKTIRIVCAANFAPYHGIDRLLNGLDNYYKNGGAAKIEVHLAGDGPELPLLKSIVDNSKCLKSCVIFYGKLESDQINHLYDVCDLGIVTLGYSRIGLDYNTTIKSKEYLAAGLPFVVDTDVDVLDSDKEYPFMYKVDYGDDAINIDDIVEFYEKNITYDINNHIRIANEMRKLAQTCADFEITMKKVVDVLKER